VDRWDLYRPKLARLFAGGLPSLSVAHVGYGVNSYTIVIARSEPGLACVVSTGWGGVYMKADVQRERHRRRVDALDQLWSLAEVSGTMDRIRAAGNALRD
jgi:predicted ABC-type ATPase